MLAMSSQEILQAAIKVDSIQSGLLTAFFVQNPDVVDFKLLSDFPKMGELRVDGEAWSYRKHGLGYSFLSDRGCVIDAHNHFNRNSGVIDAHRLTEYLLATREELGKADELYSSIENGLKALEHQGFLIRVASSPRTWRIIAARSLGSDFH